MTETLNHVAIGHRVRTARGISGISQTAAASQLGVSQPTYARIEAGQRKLTGDELVALADLFGVRAASIVGLAQIGARAVYAARTDGNAAPMTKMRDRLCECLELDAYLDDQGIPDA